MVEENKNSDQNEEVENKEENKEESEEENNENNEEVILEEKNENGGELKEDEFKKMIDEEIEKVNKEYEKRMKELGIVPFLKLDVGETVLEFLKVPPKKHSVFPNRVVFTVLKNGEKYAFGVNRYGRLYRKILENLSNGKFKMKIVRTGTSKADTRYDVQPVE